MISKVIKPAKSFGRICRYLLDKREEAVVILSEGVRDYDHRKMAEDFNMQAGQNPDLSNPVQHIILAFPPGEELSDQKLAEISLEYLAELGLDQTQYVVVSHQDKDHKHLHIVLNRVGNNGKTIKDSFLGLKGKKKAQELTRRHGLQQAEKKDLKKTHTQQMNPYDKTRYEIYRAIREGLTHSKNVKELENYLKRKEIEVIYKYKGKTDEVQGMSFKKDEFKYKASEIDRRFSYGNLQKIFKYELQKNRNIKPEMDFHLLPQEKSQLLDLLEILMKPEELYNQTPKELLMKKKRNQSKGLHL